jgi:hypothetical protein
VSQFGFDSEFARMRRKVPKITKINAARPNAKKAKIRHAVKLLAHIKSPRMIAPRKLATDATAQMAEIFSGDMQPYSHTR